MNAVIAANRKDDIHSMSIEWATNQCIGGDAAYSKTASCQVIERAVRPAEIIHGTMCSKYSEEKEWVNKRNVLKFIFFYIFQ